MTVATVEAFRTCTEDCCAAQGIVQHGDRDCGCSCHEPQEVATVEHEAFAAYYAASMSALRDVFDFLTQQAESYWRDGGQNGLFFSVREDVFVPLPVAPPALAVATVRIEPISVADLATGLLEAASNAAPAVATGEAPNRVKGSCWWCGSMEHMEDTCQSAWVAKPAPPVEPQAMRGDEGHCAACVIEGEAERCGRPDSMRASYNSAVALLRVNHAERDALRTERDRLLSTIDRKDEQMGELQDAISTQRATIEGLVGALRDLILQVEGDGNVDVGPARAALKSATPPD